MKDFTKFSFLLLFVIFSCSKEATSPLVVAEEEIETTVDSISGNSSPGQLGSPSLKKGSFFLTARFYYASDDPTTSVQNINQPDGSQREIIVFGKPDKSMKKMRWMIIKYSFTIITLLKK